MSALAPPGVGPLRRVWAMASVLWAVAVAGAVAARRRRPERDQGRTATMPRDAIVDLRFGATLRRWRIRRGMSLRQLAPRVHHGKTLLGDLETGSAQPTVALAQELDIVLDAGGEIAAMVLPADDDRARQDIATPGLTADLVPTWASGRRSIGRDTPARLLERTARLRRLDDYLGGADTYRMYRAELNSTTALLREATYPEATGRALMSVLAEQAQMAGWAAFDAGRYPEAEDLYRMSLSAAAEAGDQALAGNAWIFIAYQHLHVGGGAAVDEAVTAVETAGGVITPTVRALLRSRRAWVHAVAGEAADAERELALARTALTDDDDRPEPDWVYWVDHTEMEIMTGRCWSVLHRPMRAITVLEQVLQRYDDTHARDKALYLSWLADAYVDANEVEQACTTANRALRLSSGVGSTRPLRRLQSLVGRLEPYRALPAVSELKTALVESARWGRRTPGATRSRQQSLQPTELP